MEVKEEDPFDIEGIEKPTMKMKDYNELKAYLYGKLSSFTSLSLANGNDRPLFLADTVVTSKK